VSLPPWPPALPGEPYIPPAGRGILRLAGKEGSGRCPACGLTIQLRRDGTLVSHKRDGAQCGGTGEEPAELVPVASWLALRAGLTPHGLRHGHQTWLDEIGVRYVLQSERMGHEVPGMRGVYSHITPGMRAELKAGLQELWESSLHERALLASRSAVAILDLLLAPYRASQFKTAPILLPESDTRLKGRMAMAKPDRSDLRFYRGERWDSNPRHPGPQPGALTN
jgi:hypothetical protein